MYTPKYIYLYAAFIVLAPALLIASEGVDVSFSVQAIRLQDVVSSHLSEKAQWSLVAIDLETGNRVVDAETGDKNLAPGSLVKLLVTAAAFDQNRQDSITLSTVIGARGKISKGILDGDIVIQGSGNSMLSEDDFLTGVEKIKAQGIAEITGDVIIDDSLFGIRGWKNRYSGPAYAMPSALGLDLHTISVTAEGSKRRVVVDPPNDAVKVSFNTAGKPGIRQIDDLTYEINGSLAEGLIHNRFSLADPALYAGGTFLTLLKKSGIKVAGNVKRKLSPAPLSSPGRAQDRDTGERIKEVVRIGSRDISEYIRDMNQQSLNVAADNLLFILGAKAYGAPGTREKGIRAVNDFLQKLGVPLAGFMENDGSGVSENNRISAEQMVSFLVAVSKKPWFQAFYQSLSRPGLDGRLKDLGYRSEHVRAKSGQLPDAFCLAGYADAKDGRKIAFAYMVNGSGLDMPAARLAAVEVLKQLEGK